MHPLVLSNIAYQRIEDLHREAAVERLARQGRKQKVPRRTAPATRLQGVPAH
jgi:hypothetical protein